jgi:stage V sporulation protein R
MVEIITRENGNIHEYYTGVARDIGKFMQDMGLEFGDVEFRLVDTDELAQFAARYSEPLPTWYGYQSYRVEKESFSSNLGKLYEMVFHKYYNPIDDKNYTIALISKSDTDEEIKSVMAHVFGHLHMDDVNFIAKTADYDLDRLNAFSRRYKNLEEIINSRNLRKNGMESIVDKEYDMAKTLSTLINMYPDLKPSDEDTYYSISKDKPPNNEYDVFGFLKENVKMGDWKKEVFDMVYDISQINRTSRVKIMHEGFATFVQEKYAIYGEKDKAVSLKMLEMIYSIGNPKHDGQLPYALGFRLFKYIEDKWNKGRFGFLYEQLPESEKEQFDSKAMKGLEKILDVTKFKTDFDFVFLYADKNFVRSFLQEKVEELSDKDKEFMTWLGLDPADVEEFAKQIKEITNEDVVNFKVGLLFGLETYFPMVYIPRGGANFSGGKLSLVQDTDFIRKYVEMTGDGLSYDQVLADVAPFISLDNDRTSRALVRIAKLWDNSVFLDTIDVHGDPIRVVATPAGKVGRTSLK